MNNYPEIQELLEQRADLYARLKLLAYDGTPEIKENKSGKSICPQACRQPSDIDLC